MTEWVSTHSESLNALVAVAMGIVLISNRAAAIIVKLIEARTTRTQLLLQIRHEMQTADIPSQCRDIIIDKIDEMVGDK